MLPPFLAYYGVITDNKTVVDQAYNQVRLYHDQLYDKSAGVWRHIVGGSSDTDNGYWATGSYYILLPLASLTNTSPRQCLGCCWYAPRLRHDRPQ